MRKPAYVLFAAMLTSPAISAVTLGDYADPGVPAVDLLYPEVAVDDDGWRGLLPVIMIDTDRLSTPGPIGPVRRSEHDEDR